MPRCYLCAISWHSSIDRDSNNMSLFHLIEQAEVRAADLAGLLPFQLHHYWEFEEGERDQPFEFRTVVVGPSGKRWKSEPYLATPRTPRHRLRAVGVQVDGPGSHRVSVEYRHPGQEDWISGGLEWPLEIELRGESAAT